MYKRQGSVRLSITAAGHLLPGIDSQYNIGVSTIRFANIYADTLYGDGSNLTGIAADKIFEGNTEVETVDTGSNGHIKFTTEGTEKLRIQSDGKVGVGTDSITANLHVRTTGAGGTLLRLETDMSDSVQNRSFYIEAPEAVSTDLPFRIRTANSMLFMTDNNEALTIDINGKVGVGTISPTDVLDVYSDTDPTIRSRSGSSSVGANVEICGGSSNDSQLILSSGTTQKYQFFRDGSQSDDLRIYDSANSLDIMRYRHGGYLHFGVNGSERLRITSTGDLSLRSTTQNAFLGLTANSTAINLTLGSTDGTHPRAYFYGTGNGQTTAGDIFLGAGTGGELRFRAGQSIKLQTNSDSSTIDAFFIHAAGTVAVNTFSPDTTYRLDVAGAGQFTTSTTNQQNDFLTGQLTVRNNQSAQGAFIDFRADSANGTQGVIAKIGGFNTHSGSGYDGLLTFSTRQTSNNTMVERMRITSDGKMGIKTSTPIGTLDVYDGTFVLSKPSSNSSSRNWRFLPDNIAAGNLGLQVSTAAGGSTFQNVLEVDDDGTIFTAQNGTAFSWGSNPGHVWYADGEARSTTADGVHYRINRMNGNGHAVQFYRGQTNMVGFISITSSVTSYGSVSYTHLTLPTKA